METVQDPQFHVEKGLPRALQVGYPPFYSDDPMTTCRKIVNWRTTLRFPPEARSPNAPACLQAVRPLALGACSATAWERMRAALHPAVPCRAAYGGWGCPGQAPSCHTGRSGGPARLPNGSMVAQVQLPHSARSLIERLLCSVEDRLGSHGGAAEVKVGTPAPASPALLALALP